MTLEQKRFCEFGPFRLDRRQRVVMLAQAPLSIPPKAFDVLLALVDHRDRVVPKDELMQAVWPDVVVEEGNLSQNVFLLRKALGHQGQDGERFILTVPGRGYRFVSEATDVDEADPPARPARPKPGRLVAAGVILALLAGAGLLWTWRHQARVPPSITERQLTTNALEASLTAAAISPDGKYLAFADDYGLYLRVVATGETHTLAGPQGVRVFHMAWFTDGSKLLVSGQNDPAAPSAVWLLSILGGPARKLRDDASGAVPSPDGSQVVFTASVESEIWLMGANGESPRKIVSGEREDAFDHLGWFPDGNRIMYLRNRVISANSVESIDLRGGAPAVIVSSLGLYNACLLPDGRVLYTVGGGWAGTKATALWDVRADLTTGRAVSEARRLRVWKGSAWAATASNPSVTTDGKQVVFLRGLPEADVYVGELEDDGAQLKNARRLTLDDGDDWVSSWTSDSRSVLFVSDRTGSGDVFLQGIDETTPHVVVASTHPKSNPGLSPDGRWILYYDPSPHPSWSDLGRIRRVPLSGGPSENVMEENGLYVFRCARRSEGACIAGVMHEKELVVYALDPIRGKGKELVRTEARPGLRSYGIDLSPDGSQLAIVSPESGRPGGIRILSLADGSAHDLAVPGWKDLGHVSWAADGRSFYVSSEATFSSTLLFVRPNGESAVLFRQPSYYAEMWGIPSPDGKHLAFLRYNSGNNAWLLENF